MLNRVDPTYVSVDVGDITIVADVTAEQSTTIPDWIISHPDLSDRAVRLWAYLRGAVRGAFHLSGGSHVALSSILKTGSRSTREAIYQLRDAGALAIQPMFKDGKQMPNAYFLWPAIPDGSALIASKNGVAVFCHGGSIFPPVSTIITNNTNNTGNEAADAIEAIPAKRSRLT